MPFRSSGRQFAARRSQRRRGLQPIAVACVLALVTLFLLPMQMRAGAEDAHPHAVLQLILDARDGALDHHAPHPADDRHAHEAADAGAGHEPDVPVVETTHTAGVGAGLAILAAAVVLFQIAATQSAAQWPPFTRWRGWLAVPEPPPPRVLFT